MASSVPIVHQLAWPSLIPQLALLGVLWLGAHAAGAENPVLAGSFVYFVLLVVLRNAVPWHHRAGMRLFKKERFAEAIPRFERSYQFFAKHSWLDRWRALTLLSSSRVSYREMALLNLAFCLAQSGQRERALAEYKRTLDMFPDSKVAQLSIRMLEVGAKSES